MNYLKISLGIFTFLAISRFVPHPPNFTSLQTLSFYVPLIFGVRYIPIIVFSYFITDMYFGFHSTLFFTWSSVVIIGIMSKYFNNNFKIRILGALFGAFLFYLISNFGVWINGYYGYSFEGLINCFTLAIPFFAYSMISTFIFSSIVEFFLQQRFFFKIL